MQWPRLVFPLWPPFSKGYADVFTIGVRAPLDLGEGGGWGGGGAGSDLTARKNYTICPKPRVVQTPSNRSKNKNVYNSYVL